MKKILLFLIMVILLLGCNKKQNVSAKESKTVQQNTTSSSINKENPAIVITDVVEEEPILANENSSTQIEESNIEEEKNDDENKNEKDNIEIYPVGKLILTIMEKNSEGKSKFMVVGGYNSEKWYNIQNFVIKNNGEIISPAELEKKLSDNSYTPLSAKLILNGNGSFYMPNGGRHRLKTGKELNVTYEICQANGEVYITGEINTDGINGMFAVEDANWDFYPRKGKFVAKKMEVVDIDGDGNFEKIYYKPGKEEDSMDIELEMDGKKDKIETLYSVAEGYFLEPVDLNGDGKLELYIENQSIAGCIAVLSLNDKKKMEYKIGLDLGE